MKAPRARRERRPLRRHREQDARRGWRPGGRNHGPAVQVAGITAQPSRPGRDLGELAACRPAIHLSALVVMPAIPTNGSARSSGIILDVRIIRLRGVSGSDARVSSPYVPNIGITGTIGISPAIRMLGSRRTGHTTPNGPTIQLSPADQMVCPARGPVDDPQSRSAELLRGRER